MKCNKLVVETLLRMHSPRILSRACHSTAHKLVRGVTLAEILVTLLALGVLISLAAPTLGGLMNRNRVNDGFNDLSNALREAQANALQSSRRCIVTLDIGATPVRIRAADSQGTPCIAGRALPDGVAVATNLPGTPPPTISFSFKGNTTQSGTITVYWAAQPMLQRKCLTVSNGVGIMRLGFYTIDPTSNLSESNCKAAF